jgi:hypothetical protein
MFGDEQWWFELTSFSLRLCLGGAAFADGAALRAIPGVRNSAHGHS